MASQHLPRSTEVILRRIALEGTPREDYVQELPAMQYLKDLPYFEFRAPVTFLVGDNGAGKSTLMEAIAVNLGFSSFGGRLEPLERGTHGASSLGYAIQCALTENLHRGYYLRAETHDTMLKASDTAEERGGWSILGPGHALSSRSHGESVLDIVLEHVRGRGLYLFDEPESGLSVVRQMALLVEMKQAVDYGAQFIIATHSPFLLAYPGADIVELGQSGFERIAFAEAEPVVAARELLLDTEGTLRYLLEEPR
ncbi:AAA family ATPase [Corynebacterium sp.]|uniref:AAA family ATPase n=1 Tax=Corynebacterium sp. TaxID=1720 RepID=UPI0026DD5321|nr:AAA family ATPase [Corynebacterium sp.]MDO5031328.1 AAA family ATPase [Corynebacterium sp.]